MKRYKLLLILSLVAVIFVGCKKETKTNKENPDPDEPSSNGTATSILDGSSIDTDDVYSPVFGVMIDNHPDARPQSGLSKASIIYEFKVEGDFTRYLALFQNSNAKQIGPVRSARPYFVETISEYDGIYAHFGSSDDGASSISNLDVDDLDGMLLEGTTFYRNKDVGKSSPHNAYTSIEKLTEGVEDKNYNEKRNFDGFIFDTSGESIISQMENGNTAENISISYNPEYTVSYEYNDSEKLYSIFRNDEQIIDEYDDNEILASNIIIEYANSTIINGAGSLEIANIGQGVGKLITSGKVIDINWSKDSAVSRTVYTTTDGEEIILSPGQTWIEVIDGNTNSQIN